MPWYHPLKSLNNVERLRTINNLLKLRSQLDRDIPQKTATDTLLLATWNIREFGDNRRKESLFYLAEIISRFDLVAVQEVSTNMGGLKKLMKFLGPNWDFIATDSTDGSAGGGERMVFLYDGNKISFENIIGEITLPRERLIDGQLQFARTPCTASFQAGWFKFVLTTVHIYYGSNSVSDKKKRGNEIDTITSILSKRAKKEDISYILLGDFNIPEVEDDTMKALEKYGFTVPLAIKKHPTDMGKTNHYDQIAFNLKLDDKMTVFSEKKQKAGAFNFAETVYTEKDLGIYKEYFSDKIKDKTEQDIRKYYLSTWRTFQMSDHLPLWIELKIDFSNQYLEKIKAKI